jgi:hypothetical protein
MFFTDKNEMKVRFIAHTVLQYSSWEKVHKLRVRYKHKVVELGFRFLPPLLQVIFLGI